MRAQQQQAVAHGQQQRHHARVVLHLLIKGAHGPGIVVVGFEGVGGEGLAAPQYIVHDNQAAGPHLIDYQLKVPAVINFIGINKD